MSKISIKDNVEALLKRDDQVGFLCRNYDNFLTLYYINEYHQDLDIAFNLSTDTKKLCTWANTLPALSEIKRIRAYFQNNKGMYPADLKVIKLRKEKEKEKRQEYVQ